MASTTRRGGGSGCGRCGAPSSDGSSARCTSTARFSGSSSARRVATCSGCCSWWVTARATPSWYPSPGCGCAAPAMRGSCRSWPTLRHRGRRRGALPAPTINPRRDMAVGTVAGALDATRRRPGELVACAAASSGSLVDKAGGMDVAGSQQSVVGRNIRSHCRPDRLRGHFRNACRPGAWSRLRTTIENHQVVVQRYVARERRTLGSVSTSGLWPLVTRSSRRR